MLVAKMEDLASDAMIACRRIVPRSRLSVTLLEWKDAEKVFALAANEVA